MDKQKTRKVKCTKIKTTGKIYNSEPGFIYPSYTLPGVSHIPEPAKDLMQQSLQPANYVDR